MKQAKDRHMKTLARTTLSSGLVICLTMLLISSYAHGADKLIVKDAGGVTKFVVTDTGTVGIGTGSPSGKLRIEDNGNSNTEVQIINTTAGALAQAALHIGSDAGYGGLFKYSTTRSSYKTVAASDITFYNSASGNISILNDNASGNINFAAGGVSTAQVVLASTGNVGVGTTAPTAQLHTTGSVQFAGVYGCGQGIKSDANGNLSCANTSSRQLKNIAGDLGPVAALANVMALRPQVGSYKATPDEPEHWLIVEDVAAVDPALVGLRDGKPYTVKTQNIIADLIAVIQGQQRRIEEQQLTVEAQQRRVEALEQRFAR
jgi:hypothetical protein